MPVMKRRVNPSCLFNSEAVQKERGIAEKLSNLSSRTPIRDLLIISRDGDPATPIRDPFGKVRDDALFELLLGYSTNLRIEMRLINLPISQRLNQLTPQTPNDFLT
jgi:hypothetical protein